jgi:hypothetical protein
MVGIGQVVLPTVLDAAEDLIELVLRDEEGAVLMRDVRTGLDVVVVHRHLVAQLDTEEGTQRLRAREAEHVA